MRRVHLWVGLAAVLIFIGTGQYMRHHQPPLAQLPDRNHLLYRSRHIYILAAALVNLMLGLYLENRTGWRGALQKIGSSLILASPVLLILAFAFEPERGLDPELWRSAYGLFALFGGSVFHFISAIGRGKSV